jgi:maltooligosyltrehalose trehalohydrolase
VTGLLATRRQEIVPRLDGVAFAGAEAAESGLVTASWRMGDGATLRLTANLSASEIAAPAREPAGRNIWGTEPGNLLPPWSVIWRIGG